MDAAASTVRIAVNDVSGPPIFLANDADDMMLPLRAVRSLSRLDAVLRAEKHAAAAADAAGDVSNASEMLAMYKLAYKCPSFPRIDRYSSVDEMRLLALDADSMSPRLSNATLSQDLDGELFAMSISNLCVPSQQTSSSSRHDAVLTRSVSARTIRLSPGTAATGSTVNNLLSPSAGTTTTTTTTTSTLPSRRVTRSTSCPSMSRPVHISPSPSSLLQALPTSSLSTQRHVGKLLSTVVSTKAGKGRSEFGSDVDLDSEHVTDLPVIATT